jgi:hypothetical protein
LDNPIKDADNNSDDRSTSFVSKDTRDRSLHKLLLALAILGTNMVIIILFAYSVAYESVAASSEVLDTPSFVSNEPAATEENVVESERLVKQVLVTDGQETAQILEREGQPPEVEEILPQVSAESKNTTALASTMTHELISVPIDDNLRATVEVISEEGKEDEDPDEDRQIPRHDDSEDETKESQSVAIEDVDDTNDDVTQDYTEDNDDDRTGHKRPDRHDKNGDDDRGNGKKSNRHHED